jgi:predicted adenylyl cyclase CyaB
MDTTLEIEVKIACDSLDLLRDAKFDLQLSKPRHFEDNWLMDWPDRSLLRQGAALRIRSVDGSGLVTYKGMVQESSRSPLKIREEIEAETSEPEQMVKMLERIGLRRAFRYQKYRTVYNLTLDESRLEITFDETPMGNFIEIEGDERGVLRALERAGFSASDIIRESYPELQAARCRERGVELEDLVF